MPERNHSHRLGLEMSFLHFYLVLLLLTAPARSQTSTMDTRVLHVGKELLKETLLLQDGSCVYQLQGLKSNAWYEVKISYPASIPASFSIQLLTGCSSPGVKVGRKLLNTEKLIFKRDDNVQTGLCALVSVVPEGVVAIPGVEERKHVIFNIVTSSFDTKTKGQVCDELLMGISHKAWFVVMFVVLCLGLAFVIPSFLPPYLLPKKEDAHGPDQSVSKDL